MDDTTYGHDENGRPEIRVPLDSDNTELTANEISISMLGTADQWGPLTEGELPPW